MITFQEFRENLIEFKIQKSAVAKSPTQRRMERRKKMLGGGRQREKLAIKNGDDRQRVKELLTHNDNKE